MTTAEILKSVLTLKLLTLIYKVVIITLVLKIQLEIGHMIESRLREASPSRGDVAVENI